jgi:Tfp pilus assembly PilM family ATPase
MANKKNKRAIGLMLNSAEMRAIELSGTLHQPKVAAFGRMALPPGLISDGMLTVFPMRLPCWGNC